MTIKQMWCGLIRGHAFLFRHEPARVALVCTECDYVSPGMQVGDLQEIKLRKVFGLPPRSMA